MRFLRSADSPLVHMVDCDTNISYCGLSHAYLAWKYPQTPFGLEYMCDACIAEWVLLQMAGRTITLYNWFDELANRPYKAQEGFDGLLY